MMYILSLRTAGQTRLASRDDVVEHERRDRRRRTDGGESEPAVGVFPNGVVDAADHLGHVEDVARHLGGHDVAVVAVRDRDECGRLFDPGAAEDVLVDAGADDGVATKVGWQATKGERVGVDDGHVVAVVIEDRGDARADAATPHNDDFHPRRVSSRQSAWARRTTMTSHSAFLST